MSATLQTPGDVIAGGNLIAAGNLVLSAGALPASYMAAASQKASYAQVPGTSIVAATQDLTIIGGSTGRSVRVMAANNGALASDNTNIITIDVHRSTGGGAFATILTAPITFTNTDSLRTYKVVTPNTTALLAGDILRVIITVAHSTGTQAQGLIVVVDWQEAP